MKKMIRCIAGFCLLWLFAVEAYAQQTLPLVKGVVIDNAGEALIGASVIVKNTKQGTATDLEGRFQLTDVATNATLEISYLGYRTKLVAVNGKTEISILLETDETALEEVVVTGYNRIDKRLFTGATDRLNAEDIKISGLSEISRSLEGRSAGVSVQNVSGTFGARPKIRVRGATSIYGSSNPLWVVDGVIMEDVKDVDADALSSGDAETLISSAIAGLNASDIESFQILKDGSATSIYGAKAMAGVIVITTKKGKSGTSQINYSGEFTSRLIPSYNEFNIMNSQEQMSVYKEMKEKGWLDYAKLFRRSSYGVYGKLAEQMFTVDPKTGDFYIPSTWSNEYENSYLREAEYRNTNWFEELFNSNLVQNHSVSLSGGTEKSNYYASMSAVLDPGYTLQSNVKRYTMNMNLSHKIYNNLTLNLNGKGYYRNQRAPGTTKSKLDALEGRVNREFDINPYSYALNTSRTLDPNTFYRRYYSPFNIKHELENNYIDLNETSLNFIGDITWSPIKGLELKAMGAIKYTDSSRENFIKENSNQAMAFRAGAVPVDDNIRSRNNFLYQDKDDPQYPHNVEESVLPVGGIYDRDQNRMSGWDFRASANYSTSLNEGKHIINLFAGTEWNSVEKSAAWFRSWGIQFAKGNQGLFDYHAFKKWSEENADYYSLSSTLRREQAYFANASYSYLGRYTINGTWRYEGSNQMGKTRLARWLPTWNISGAWNAHEESFFNLVRPTLSHFTLRTSYSLTAQAPPLSVSNAAIDIRSYTPWRFWQEYRESGLEIYKNANEGLTYEKKHELNIGGDFGFFDNRVNLVVDWYTRNNYDLIGDITTQQGDTKGNVAAMKSQGIEFTLGTKNIKTGNFNWNTDFTFARTDVKITKLYSVNRIVDLVSGSGFGLEGYSYRMLFSLPFDGLNEDGIPMMYDGNGNLINSTTLQLRGADNFAFLVAEGPKEPTYQGGFGNTFRYKNIRLNVFITYSGGNKLRLDPVFRSSYTDLSAMPKEFANRWVLPGDEAYTNVPAILSERQTSFGDFKSTVSYLYSTYNYSTERVADGSFARLKEVSISYNFPKALLTAVKFNNLSVKLQATNLALLYADKKLNGQDPEFMNSGGVATPIPRQFTLTVNVGL